MGLKFKKLAFQKNKFQLIWTSFDTSNQLLNSNCLGCSCGTVFTRFCFYYFLDQTTSKCWNSFFVNSVRMSSLFVMLSTKAEEHVKGVNSIILSKLHGFWICTVWKIWLIKVLNDVQIMIFKMGEGVSRHLEASPHWRKPHISHQNAVAQ